MTEQRKIQLATEVDASGAAQGFERIKTGARDMAQTVTQAGQQAGKGLGAIADSAKRAGDGWTREEGRIRSVIQRTTLDLQTLGKTMSEKLEAKIAIQGLDGAKFAPYLAQLREVEQAQAAAARGAAETAAAIKTAQATSASRTSFLGSLKSESDAIGKTRSELLALRAAELGVAEAAAPMIAKLREAEAAQRGVAAAGKLTAFQQQQIGFQLHDFAVQVASGQNPVTALVQQGSQLSGTFGGTGNAIRAVTSLITPMKLAIGGAAAAVGGLALAMAHAESSARDLAAVQNQLAGTGRADIFSTKALKDYLAELSKAPGVTRDTAAAIVAELSKVQGINGVFKDLGRLAVDYAAATGQKVPEAARELARAFADPEKGARALDAALGALSSTQLLEIDRLTRLGNVAGAQRIMFDALQQSIGGLAERGLTPLQRSTNELGNAWERLQRTLGESQGLQTLLGLLAKVIDSVTWLINNGPKLGQLPSFTAAIPGGAPVVAAKGITDRLRSLIGLEPTDAAAADPAKSREARGAITDLTGAKAGNTAATAAGNKAADEEIKRALEAGKAYKSQASEITNLKQERERFNKALQQSIELYGKDSPQAKALRGSIAGVNERIASVSKRGQSSGGNEAQQVLDAELQQSLKASQDALAREREQIAFSQRYLQGVYQQGQISLRDFYDEKRKTIEQGVAAEIAELEKERAAVEKHLAATRKTSPKDTSAIVRDQTRLQEIDAQEAKLRAGASREVVLANQEQEAAYRQLNEQVLAYRANLLQLQGDEAGAAKIRAQIAIEQARVLAKQSQGSAAPITEADQQATAAAITQTNEIAAARTRLGLVTQDLSLAEERIATLQRAGAIGELEALDRMGAARAARLGQLQKEVEAIEKLAQERPLDLQLRVDASRARLELEGLKAQLDPLKEKFDGIFKDAGANLFSDLANGTKPLQAIRKFGDNIAGQISGVLGRQFSDQIFGDGGLFGGLGKAAADVFGSKNRGVSLDTSSAEQSLTTLRTAGADPATTALQQLAEAAQATAVELRTVRGTDLPPAGPAAGVPREAQSDAIFSAAARAQDEATEATTAGADATLRAAGAVTQLAAAATRGGDALSSLPAILQALTASFGGGGNPGNLIGSALSFFTGGGGVSDFAFAGTTFADALGAGMIPLSKGGYTGDVDPKKVAGVVHGREYVFSADATAAIGVSRLERLHRMARTGQVEERPGVRGFYDGGYVSIPGDRLQTLNSMQYLVPPQQQPVKAGDTHTTHNHISVSADISPGVSRATAMQRGAEFGQGIAVSLKRQGKRR